MASTETSASDAHQAASRQQATDDSISIKSEKTTPKGGRKAEKNENTAGPGRRGSNKKRRPYQFLYSTITLRLMHQEARRIVESGELLTVTRNYYQMETVLIPLVGRDQIAELQEMYRERGQKTLDTIQEEEARLEKLFLNEGGGNAFEDGGDIDDVLESLNTRDNEVSTLEYRRSAGGQNKFLEVMSHFDRACCLADALFIADILSPVQRYDAITMLRNEVLGLIKLIKEQYRQAVRLSEKRKKKQQQQRAEKEAQKEARRQAQRAGAQVSDDSEKGGADTMSAPDGVAPTTAKRDKASDGSSLDTTNASPAAGASDARSKQPVDAASSADNKKKSSGAAKGTPESGLG